jgi:hypothetical protein
MTYGIEFLFGDVLSFSAGSDGPERVLDFLRALHVLRLLAYHERHVLLQGHVTVSVRVNAL